MSADGEGEMSEATLQPEDTRSSSGLSRDDLFELLSNRRRRYVLHYLKTTDDGRANLDEVVEQVAAWEKNKTVDEISYDDRRSVYISLYQHHASKMDEAGLINYDERKGVMALTTEAEEVDIYPESAPESDVPWHVYFPALWGVCAFVVAVEWFDPVPFEVPDIGLTVFVLVTFGISSLAFTYDRWYRTRVGQTGAPPEVNEGE